MSRAARPLTLLLLVAVLLAAAAGAADPAPAAAAGTAAAAAALPVKGEPTAKHPGSVLRAEVTQLAKADAKDAAEAKKEELTARKAAGPEPKDAAVKATKNDEYREFEGTTTVTRIAGKAAAKAEEKGAKSAVKADLRSTKAADAADASAAKAEWKATAGAEPQGPKPKVKNPWKEEKVEFKGSELKSKGAITKGQAKAEDKAAHQAAADEAAELAAQDARDAAKAKAVELDTRKSEAATAPPEPKVSSSKQWKEEKSEFKGTVEKTHPLHDARVAAKAGNASAPAAAAALGRRMLSQRVLLATPLNATSAKATAPKTVNHFPTRPPPKHHGHTPGRNQAVQVKPSAKAAKAHATKGNATHQAAKAPAPAPPQQGRVGRLLRRLLSIL